MEAYVRPWLLAVILTCLAPLGCRGPDPSIELLESELRCMEDQLYEMDRQLGIYGAQLESCRRYNASLRLQLATTEDLPAPEPQPAPKPAQREGEAEQVPAPAEPSFDEADLTVP